MQDDVIAYADARDLLRLLEPIRGQLVLIGGQAVNFWAERYAARAAELQKEAPFASKDVDFCGDVDLARQCAKLLGGVCKVSTPDDRHIALNLIRSVSGPKVPKVGVHNKRLIAGWNNELLLRSLGICRE